LQEGKPLGFTILKFTITDADAPPNTSPFKFDILSGNEELAFRIVQQDGTLRTATKFDHKYRSEYILHIKATDNGNPPLSSDTWVTIIVIEESQFAPIITPLDVAVSSYLDDFPGGVVGRVHAMDEDPYDKLVYHIVSPHETLFTVDREDGTLFALAGLDVGIYDVNVSVSDGKFTSFTTVTVEVAVVTEDARKHSVAVRLNDVTPEDFLLTYRKGFHRGLRNILNVRTKDIEIISMQPTVEENIRKERSALQDLDVVFAVRKGNRGFYPPKLVRSKLKEKKETLEASLGLSVVKVCICVCIYR
ncbi:fat-like cadherin-related tumor suppressor homolog, partial [Centruroides sculpturatus]|uniref:fat-like cadherin-related tumor suppressor homolog n=1 Tax=Centruroides sculpturatus TaxID=218467 RepID=UPI000C6D23D6